MSDYNPSNVDYWNVKVYDEDRERETLRGLTYGRAECLMRIFDREGVRAQAMAFDEDGKFVQGSGDSVNWTQHRVISDE